MSVIISICLKSSSSKSRKYIDFNSISQSKKVSSTEFNIDKTPAFRSKDGTLYSGNDCAAWAEEHKTDGRRLDTSYATMKELYSQYNKLNVYTHFNGTSLSETPLYNIQGWQTYSGAIAMFNSAQYEAEPWGQPCGLLLARGKRLGPKTHKQARGILVAEPRNNNLPLIDLIDLKYEKFDADKTPYTEAVMHWPILLDRKENIRVKVTDWQANRTVVGKDNNGKFLVFTTLGGYFTLYNFGKFLKESNHRLDKGFNINTAMNMDGGYEAEMIVKTPNFKFLTYGQYETYGTSPSQNVSIANAKIGLPTAIGISPRNSKQK